MTHKNQIRKLKHFQLYLEGQNNFFDFDLTGKKYIQTYVIFLMDKNKTQSKSNSQIPQETKTFPRIEKHGLIDRKNLAAPSDLSKKTKKWKSFGIKEFIDSFQWQILMIKKIY